MKSSVALPYAPDELVWVIGVNKAGCVSIGKPADANITFGRND